MSIASTRKTALRPPPMPMPRSPVHSSSSYASQSSPSPVTKTMTPAPSAPEIPVPPSIAANPAKLARYNAMKAHRNALQAAHAAGKTTTRKRAASGTVALDLSPLVKASTNVPVFNVENAADFSAADKALFARVAGTDKTAITMTQQYSTNASSGQLATRNAIVEWNSGDQYIETNTNTVPPTVVIHPAEAYMTMYTRGGNRTDTGDVYEGSDWEYFLGRYDHLDGLVLTRVEFVPLERNGSGDISTFRVDFYKKIMSATAVFLAYGENILDVLPGVFSTTTEKLAFQFLVTERIVQNAYVQSDVRVLQSADEIALQEYLANLSGPNYRGGSFLVRFNGEKETFEGEGSFAPSGSVADVQSQGLIEADAKYTPPAGWTRTEDDSNTNFLFSADSTTNGLVFHTRVPISFFTLSKPSDTLGTPLPLWVMLLLVLALVLGIFNAVKMHQASKQGK